MKQQLSRSENKAKDTPTTQSPNPIDPNHTHISITASRSTLLNKLNPDGDHAMGREMEITGHPENRVVEQYARLRRRSDTSSKGSENGTYGKTELHKRLAATEGLVKDLRCQVLDLKARLEKLQSINAEMESQNKQLVEDLSAAETKITSLERRDRAASVSQETVQASEFMNARKIIANKLDHFIRVKKEIAREDSHSMESESKSKSKSGAKAVEIHMPPKVSMMKPPFPPPPPPPPPALKRANTTTQKKASALGELYHSLTKPNGVKDPLRSGNRGSHVANNAVHDNIVGELQNRSAHLLAIKADVETKGDFIKHLIEKVQSAAYTDMEDVLTFVDWLDKELSTLADERGVLKHFNWPERKADALREAAFEYRDLKRLLVEVSFIEDDASLPCEAILKKIESLLDKLERSIHGLIKLRSTRMISFREHKIPIDWMLDSGMVSKMKLGCVLLAKVYMKRVLVEVELLPHSERELVVITQGVRFAYRAHQIAGGFDPETMHAFEELRERRLHPQHHLKGIS